jgi:DNA mismatch endonuclease (patch repair protein)
LKWLKKKTRDMDIKSKEARSRNMAKIRSKNTKPEMYIRSLLYAQGLRYRVNYKEVPGTPDLYFIRPKVAIFVNGCFWHRHEGCKYAYVPKSNVEFWKDKFEKNILHDNKVKKDLCNHCIRELIVWECTIERMKKDNIYNEKMLARIMKFMDDNSEKFLEI